MMLPLGLLLAVAMQSPSDSLRSVAAQVSDEALVLEVRARPGAVREAMAEALARSVRAPASSAEELVLARRFAAAYATAWTDSFLVREVERFAARPPAHRAAKIWTDSVRRAGVAAFSRDGSAAALRIWGLGLRRSRSISDTAGMAAMLGNIGAAFLEQERLDSAGASFERARRLASAVGDLRVQANAIVGLGEVSAARGDVAGARRHHAQALALHERIGDTRGVAADHNNLGVLAQSAGDLAEARERFESALAMHRDAGRDDLAATNLVNLAAIASAEGDLTRAQQLYLDALATWRAREDWADAADALHGLGQLEMRRGDYVAARRTLREALGIYERTGPLEQTLAVQRDLSRALVAMGALQDALDVLRRAERSADSAGAGASTRAKADLVLARADILVQLNNPEQAARLYASAEALYRRAGERMGEAEAQHGRGSLLLEHDDAIAARVPLLAALRAQVAAANHRAAALTRISLGRAHRAADDTAEARRQFTRAFTDLSRLGDPVGAAAALGERGALAAAAGSFAAADSLYRAALRALEGREAPDITWRLRVGVAQAQRARGNVDVAARQLREALADIERPGRSLTLAERRSAFFADKWDVYAQLALVEHRRGRATAAFETSERLRAREMLELLARGRVTPQSDAPADVVRREQDLRRRIAELTHEPAGTTGATLALRGPAAGPSGAVEREALLGAQAAYAELLLEMRERAPRHAELVQRQPASWRDVATRLAADGVMIEYLVSDSGSLAFVVTRDTLRVVDLGIGRRELARMVEFARGTVDTRPTGRGEDAWRGASRRLHQYLIAPVEETGLLAGKARLLLVPHAELHYLPFAALLNGGPAERYLVQRFEIAVTPSASVWLALGHRAGTATRGVLAMGPRTDALKGSEREVAAIARLAGVDATVLSGAAATEDAFRREAPTRRVLHLATFGVLNKQNPLFSYVELAPGAAQDGRLEVHEVFGLSLAADLVVLSACQTGLASGALADVPTGDDWLGLTRAFLHAGASRVMATLWSVDDLASAGLMEQFYEAFMAGADSEAGLARAQRRLLAAPATAHPFYWAGYVVVRGDGGRGR